MPTPVTVQLGLFGPARIVEVHVVSAHARVRADGSEVWVSEHLRWSRGRSAIRSVPAPSAPVRDPETAGDGRQLALWR